MPGDRLLTAQEAADMLGLKPGTLYTWASNRKIPSVKMGGALRFRLSAIQKLMTQSERPPIL